MLTKIYEKMKYLSGFALYLETQKCILNIPKEFIYLSKHFLPNFTLAQSSIQCLHLTTGVSTCMHSTKTSFRQNHVTSSHTVNPMVSLFVPLNGQATAWLQGQSLISKLLTKEGVQNVLLIQTKPISVFLKNG